MLECKGNEIIKGVNYLPNIKASILSVKSDAKRHAKNAAEKSRVRTASRRVLDAVEAGNADEAKSLTMCITRTAQLAKSPVWLAKSTRSQNNPVWDCITNPRFFRKRGFLRIWKGSL